ncbi:unnamed protein product [Clavelina lepadiformis]|uniref:Hexosyltransferase n=2 Tax=Clavelina lepadiformis TaxID=159417 RepID=A0ABP0FE57_CLALP
MNTELESFEKDLLMCKLLASECRGMAKCIPRRLYLASIFWTMLKFFVGLSFGYLIGMFVFNSFATRCKNSVQEYSYPHTPAFFKQRTNERESSIYIGIMSTEERLSTRIAASLSTWINHTDVTVEIFAGNKGTFDPKSNYVIGYLDGVRVIQLPGLNDHDYPPTKKFYSMLKFMHSFRINKYDWFVRLDDDAYANGQKLRRFLNRVNSSQPWYIGQPGFGKSKEDLIEWGKSFCLGGPGAIFSRSLLLKLGPHLGHCLQNLYTIHDDIEISRCIYEVAGIDCTTALDGKRLFYQNYNLGGSLSSYGENIKEITGESLDDGIIFHANKDPTYQYFFQKMVQQRKLEALILKAIRFEKEKEALDLEKERRRQLTWNAILGNGFYYERQRVRSKKTKLFSRILEHLAYQMKLKYDKQKHYTNRELISLNITLMNVYHSVDPTSSNDFPSTVLATLKNRRKQKVFLPMLGRQFFPRSIAFSRVMNDRSKTRVNFLMALSGRINTFKMFLKHFETAILKTDQNVNLFISLFLDDVTEQQWKTKYYNSNQDKSTFEEQITKMVKNTNRSYQHSRIEVVYITKNVFSRGHGLQKTSQFVVDDNEILFFCDVDLIFKPGLLERLRKNTVKGNQVYYPTFFSQHDPKLTNFEEKSDKPFFNLDEENGFWREFSYGMFSIYKSDFSQTKGFDLNIQGWGLEDEIMVKNIIKNGLNVFKSRDPGIFHVYHDKACTKLLSPLQYNNCQRSKASHYGSLKHLYDLWLRNGKNLSKVWLS